MAGQPLRAVIDAVLGTVADTTQKPTVDFTPSDYVRIGQTLARDSVREAMLGDSNEADGIAVLAAVYALPEAPAKHISDYTPGDLVESGKAALRATLVAAIVANAEIANVLGHGDLS